MSQRAHPIARRQEEEDTHALLDSLAAELLDEVRAEQPEWAAKFTAEHERDRAGYAFECRRHGTFLALVITRKGNPQTDSIFGAKTHEREQIISVNLSLCRRVRCVPGHPPDQHGKARFGYHLKYETGSTIIGGTNFGNFAAPSGSRWVVGKPGYWIPHGRPLFVADRPKRHYDGDDDAYTIRTTTDVARSAEDDAVVFDGIGTLYAPASLGLGVYETILAAIATKA